MESTTTSAESSGTHSAGSQPPLVRPVNGRVIAGVAAGVARYTGLSVGLTRFLFVALAVLGGVGLALYVAGWLLIRAENHSESVAACWIHNVRGGPPWFGVILLVVAGMFILGNLTWLSDSLVWATILIVLGVLLYRGELTPNSARPTEPGEPSTPSEPPTTPAARGAMGALTPPPAPPAPHVPPPPAAPPAPPAPPSMLGRLTLGVGFLALGVMAVLDNLTSLIEPTPRHYLALATVVLGTGLLVGGFLGRARWLILLGFFLIPPLLVSPAAEIDWERGLNHEFAPLDLGDLEPAYETAAGRYTFDLTEADWVGQDVELEVDVAAGEIVLIVPDDVAVTGLARVGIGDLTTPGRSQGGLGSFEHVLDVPGTQGNLHVDLDVGAGSITVTER